MTPVSHAVLRFAARPGAVAGLVVLGLLAFGNLLPLEEMPRALATAVAAVPATLSTAFAAAAVGTVLGVGWGGLAIFSGGVEIVRRLGGLPLLLIAALVPGLIGAGANVLVAAVGLAVAPTVAVPANAALRAVVKRDFVVTARASGFTERAILVRVILPNAAGPLIAAGWQALAPALIGVILAEIVVADGVSWGGLLMGSAGVNAAASSLAAALLLCVALAALMGVARGLAAAGRVEGER